MEPAKKYIVMVGPSTDSHGGIASVVGAWEHAGIFCRWPIVYLETHVEGSRFDKLIVGCYALLRFITLLILNRVACVHLHVARHTSFWRKSIFALAGFIMQRPVLLHLHSGRFPAFVHDDCNRLQKQFVRFILNHADQLIVLSGNWSGTLRSMSTNRRITVIANFLVPPPQLPDEATRRKCHILFLGLLSRDKGFFDLLEAIVPLCVEFPSLRLVCGGKGKQAEVHNRIHQLGLEQHVELLGWVTGAVKEGCLSQASFYVLPSYVEGIPLGVLEAMAWGMPVVASKVGGIPDIIEDRCEGLLMQAGDIPGLQSAIRRLLQNDEERRRMGLSARRKIETTFSPTAVLPSIDLLYGQYCNRSTAVFEMSPAQMERRR